MSNITVKINQGYLRGTTIEDKARKYYAFLGIPYGKPPIGDLRFKSPQPADGWSGVRDAIEEGNPCKSKHSEKFHVQGEEDCLYLNVYTPELPTHAQEQQRQRPLAVMVWIHGGGFHMGSSTGNTYGPRFILTEDVVFVSLNYRLGIFGFLSFEDSSVGVPGNAGLKDQVLALKWIHENISAFGGDPNNVTIFGESAGAASVHYLILSPLTKGLFSKAIIQSGVAINPWARGQHISDKIAEVIGTPGASEKKVYNELMKKTADELFEIQCKIPDTHESSRLRPFVPVIEQPSAEAFISEEPIKLLTSGKYNHVPLLMGYTSREGMLAYLIKVQIGLPPFVSDLEAEIPYILNLQRGTQESMNIARDMKAFYFGNEEPSAENIDKTNLITTDMYFMRGIQTAAKLHSKTSSHPVYFYRFSIDGELNFLKKRLQTLEGRGVCHADDLGYIFHSEWTPEIVPNSAEDIIQRSILRLWTNFAKYGDPNAGEKDNLIEVQWQPVSGDTLHFLDIGENLTVGVNPDRSRMEFWNKIFSAFPHAKDY